MAREITVRVPAAVRIARSLDSLSVSVDPAAVASTTLAVGAGMVAGIEAETYVYPIGGKRPATRSTTLASPPSADLGMGTWNAKDGIPAPGKRYEVDMDITIFETDVPVEHEWMPRSGKHYKVLWTRSLHQTEE